MNQVNPHGCANLMVSSGCKISIGPFRLCDLTSPHVLDVSCGACLSLATAWLPRNYVVQLVIKISSDEGFATSQKHFLTKLNETLVQIVKQEIEGAQGERGRTKIHVEPLGPCQSRM